MAAFNRKCKSGGVEPVAALETFFLDKNLRIQYVENRIVGILKEVAGRCACL